MTTTSSTSQSTLPPGWATSAKGPVMQVWYFVKTTRLARLEARLGGVVDVVQPDRVDLRGARHRRPQLLALEGLAAPVQACAAGPGAEVFPGLEDRLRIGAEAALAGSFDVDGAVVVDDHEPALQVCDTHPCAPSVDCR